MTTRQFLSSRAMAAYATWVPDVPGKVTFFSAENSSHAALEAGLPADAVVSLTGVDDTYPPQKKSFLLLKYMHDVHLNDYEWFMRADDDLYIRPDKLTRFLRSINHTKTLYIGQSGRGNREEFDTLSLDGKANYCMGGPGMVFSRQTLKKIVPHINHCLSNLFTTHEDVEIGRCVKLFAKIDCTWAFQMSRLFHHNKKEDYIKSLGSNQVQQAITLHPVKTSPTVYHIHRHFRGDQLNAVLRRRQSLVTSLRALRNRDLLTSATVTRHLNYEQIPSNLTSTSVPAPTSTTPSSRAPTPSPSDLDPWTSFGSPSLLQSAPSRLLHPWTYFDSEAYDYDMMKIKFDTDSQSALQDISNEAMSIINKESVPRGRTMTLTKIIYGFRNVHPLRGSTYIFDIMMSYLKFDKFQETKKIQVRRHSYLHQPFLEAHCIDTDSLFNDHYFKEVQKPSKHEILHFIIPLFGRYDKLVTFMKYLKRAALDSNEAKVVVALMLYSDEKTRDAAKSIAFVRQLEQQYPFHKFIVHAMSGKFSRAQALTDGANLFSKSALLVFIDVDIAVSKKALQRFRTNTIRGKTPFFPIVFSRYSDEMACQNITKEDCNNTLELSEELGYWRNFGFGIASMFNSDFKRVGGFDLSIKGWGREDVELFRAFVNYDYTTFRALDPGLVHLYHAHPCDPQLPAVQKNMCKCSRASSHGSMAVLSDLVYRKLDKR